MADSFISKRAVFHKGLQRRFMLRLRKVLPVSALARLAGCSERTIRIWCEEKYLIPVMTVHRLSRAAKLPLPRFKELDARARARRAGKLGGTALIQKYGRVPVQESYRSKRWLEWWKREGKRDLPQEFRAKEVKKPGRTAELAEFVGIMMGDGGMSKYQAIISLNSRDDAAYAVFVSGMIRKLFGVVPAMYQDPKDAVTDIVVSRANLVRFLHGLGLPIGDKIRQGLDMPPWVRGNRRYAIACVRGLVDTDGCIFTHRYRVNGTSYAYKKLSFTSASPRLVASVSSVLRDLGLTPRIARDGRDVRLDSKADMKRYLALIGTNNPKHLKRYGNRVGYER